MKVYERFANSVVAYQNCIKADNEEWMDKHEQTIQNAINVYMPHGSGIDAKTELDYEKSDENKLVFYSSYHAMNENGYYDGWIDFTIQVLPSLSHRFNLKITGNFGKYQDIKDYLYDLYYDYLGREYEG